MASSRTAIIAAIVGNGAIAVTKFAAAAITGSSAMLSEAIHSVVDTGNGALLLFGISRSRRKPDPNHPFGHGKEVYFWSFVVAILIFAVGGGVSAYEGVEHLRHPAPATNPMVNYIVLGFAFVFEGVAWTIALRAFMRVKGSQSIWGAIRSSKDPTTFAVLLEDSAAMAGIIVAFTGILLSQVLEAPVLDGVASIGIGMLLMSVAGVLAYECKGLLVGEAAAPATVTSIRTIAGGDPAVAAVGDLLTMHLGPQRILVNLNLQFRSSLRAEEIEQSIDRIEAAIRVAHPDVSRIFIEAESLTRRTGPAAR